MYWLHRRSEVLDFGTKIRDDWRARAKEAAAAEATVHEHLPNEGEPETTAMVDEWRIMTRLGRREGAKRNKIPWFFVEKQGDAKRKEGVGTRT